jgi:hypothetical protein
LSDHDFVLRTRIWASKQIFGAMPMLRLLGFSLLLLLPVVDACAQPLRFVCEPPRGKRLEQTAAGKPAGEPVWADDFLENVLPAVTIDGETLTVTWGSTIPNPTKGAAPKATTYVFASAYRNDQSILATRTDRTGAEIFRFYFGSKTLLRLGSISGSTSADMTAPMMAAVQIADCRDQ